MQVPTVSIKNAGLTYHQTPVFSNLNLELKAGQWVGLLGPSGIGKSSLLRMIAGLSTPNEVRAGTICADNTPLHPQIAYMAQTDLLLPWLTVLSNATLGIKLNPDSGSICAQTIETAKALLDKMGLSKALGLYPHQLSGGMRQRVALVRTFLQNKPIVLMDEPFSALDAITRYQLQELAYELLEGKTVFFITHDPSEALRLAHEIYIMQGEPAVLRLVATPSQPAPRNLTDPEVVLLQAHLFQTLSQAQREML